MLDVRIETFLELCHTMSYTKTAEHLFITQPAVTQHIQFLEKKYGVKLFEYRSKTLSLTRAGEALREMSMQMKVNSIAVSERLRMLQGKKESLKIGATKSIGDYIMPCILSDFIFIHPEAEVSLCVNNTRELLQELESGKIDAAFVEGFFSRNSYESRVLSHVPFFAVCGKNHPFSQGQVSFEKLTQETLFLREPGSGTRQIAMQILNEHNIALDDFHAVTEISSFAVIGELVRNNQGITFAYETVTKDWIEKGYVVPVSIEDFSAARAFRYVFTKNSLREQELLNFYQFCKDGSYFKSMPSI